MSTLSAQQPEWESMDREVPLQTPICIGEWLVQPQLNRLQHRHSDLCRQLEPRLVHLLCYLAANAYQVLTRDELIEELWPQVIVNENSLTRAISELRKHLSLDATTALVYIETIPKKGYRLLPAVESAHSVASPVAIPAPAFLPAMNGSSKAAISALCLTLVLDAWLSLPSAPEPKVKLSSPLLIAAEPADNGVQWNGAKLILSATKATTYRSKSLDTPVVSYAGDQYAYISHDRSGSTIFLGNLGEIAEPVAVFSGRTTLFNLAWSPVGNSLLFASEVQLTQPALLSAVEASGNHENANFLMLDLDSMSLRQLIEHTPAINSNPVKSINLS